MNFMDSTNLRPHNGFVLLRGSPSLRHLLAILYNITLSQGMMTMCSNDTLVDTPFQLISGFFHVNQGVLCCKHAEQASSRGVLEGGGTTCRLAK